MPKHDQKRVRDLNHVLRRILLGVFLMILSSGAPAWADLAFVSGKPAGDPNLLTSIPPGGNPADVAVSLSNGFPIWYSDDGVQKLQLCLDTDLQVAPGVVVNPCEFGPPFPGAPPSFPSNFGPEAVYWAAAAAGTYTSSGGILNSALLILAQEAGFANEGPIADGGQAVFSRIRIRIDVPVAGTYRVTHPYGQFDYVVAIPGVRAINQTQDIGVAVAQNFLLSMTGVPPVVPVPFDPSVSAGIVNATGATIGPFLRPAVAHGGVFNPNDPATFAGGPITINGATYIGLPFAPNPAIPILPIDVFQPVTGSAFDPDGEGPANYFRIELLNPPEGFVLNTVNGTQVVQFDGFQITGKVFNDGANIAPAAPGNVTAATAASRSFSVDVFPDPAAAELIDPVGVGNTHGLDLLAIAVADDNGPVLNANGMPILTEALPTARGGTVRRITAIPTGKTTFLYTPPPAVDGTLFTGEDSFQYVVQDTGGLISAPALASVLVEDLRITRAEFRVKTGKWHIRGASSESEANIVSLQGGPRARLTGAANQPPAATNSAGAAGLQVGESSIGFVLEVDPLPTGAVTDAAVHLGEPGENGPAVFFLYFDFFDGPFTGRLSGTLTSSDLLPQPNAGVSSFADAAAAIREGRCYVRVNTVTNPTGELRGQLVRPMIAEVPVTDGEWEFSGKAIVGPGSLPGVSATSANGVETFEVPLRLR